MRPISTLKLPDRLSKTAIFSKNYCNKFGIKIKLNENDAKKKQTCQLSNVHKNSLTNFYYHRLDWPKLVE